MSLTKTFKKLTLNLLKLLRTTVMVLSNKQTSFFNDKIVDYTKFIQKMFAVDTPTYYVYTRIKNYKALKSVLTMLEPNTLAY